MTYCLGIKVASGLVAIADTRLTSGSEVSSNRKISVHELENHSLFIMTSGLRSVRDKAITYFREVIGEKDRSFNKLYKAVNAFGEQVRRVAIEDKAALEASGMHFNLNAIVGGQLEDDEEHKLFLLYPEGNWVEVDHGSPFKIIGNSGYGKPLLYRNLTYESSLQDALKMGFLAFDATRVSANDVDYPLDVVVYAKDSFHLTEHRLEKEDMEGVSNQWSALLNNSVRKLPTAWMNPIFDKIL
ncbi:MULTISPECIES: peptidase [Larkinella]|jgi:putative proteasome-type protease|uniref:Peptidase n=2 Tax=Larkinella TaxID=332157 RepID=A0A5N1JCH5_9BACT|nr:MULTISPECIES: peptidase [Larkinella]KAA9347780.1 peptidase [Larkinella humicola]RCR69394.1 peptidase [Larkinella punicea]